MDRYKQFKNINLYQEKKINKFMYKKGLNKFTIITNILILI